LIKQIALLKKKTGMTPEAFLQRYEGGHVPLVLSLVPYFTGYRRSFILPPDRISVPQTPARGEQPDFHVITELWFEDQVQLDRLGRDLAETDAGQLIAADESDLFDRSRMIMFAADEFVTEPRQLAPRPANRREDAAVKLVGILKAKPGLSREAFIECYEQRHCPLATRLLARDGVPTFAAYSRSYPARDGLFPMAHVAEPLSDVGFDVMTQLWFWTGDDYRAFLQLRADPANASELSAGSGNLFEHGSTSLFLTRECVSSREAIETARCARR
jgi:hypothetical protein